jgi:hypothetical protein
LSKKIRIINGNNNNFKTTKNRVPKIPKTKAKTPNNKANMRANGVKAKTITKKSSFKPTINSSIAMKISMIVLKYVVI